MRIAFASVVVCLSLGTMFAADTDPVRMLATAPLRFEPAPGDTSAFAASGLRYRFSFTPDGAVLNAAGQTIGIHFDGAAAGARIEGTDKLRSTTNIFHGNDPSQWRTGIPNFGRVRVQDLYSGVDLVYYGNRGELEYDLIVKPGADSKQIRLRFTGADPHIDRNGDLVAGFIQRRPVAYEIAENGERKALKSRYRRNADGSFGFSLGGHDRNHEVVIDPVLTLASYFGGVNQDAATSIGHDTIGFIYVAGTTFSSDFSTTANAYSATLGGTSDVFFIKMDPNAAAGSQVIVSTFLGGTLQENLGDMMVTPAGRIYLAGSTTSTDLPMVGATQTALSGTSDAFVMELDPTQSNGGMLVFSTYLGGTGDDAANGIDVDSKGRIFVTGTTNSGDFPMASAFQTVQGSRRTTFISGIDPSTPSLFFSSYLGGAGGDDGRGIAVAPDGTVWVVGGTYSNDFPVKNCYQCNYAGVGDAYAAHIDASAGSLLYATYIGGASTDEATRVFVDPSGRVIVGGYTGSANFPVTPNAMQTNYGGNYDAFVSILDSTNTSSNRANQLYYSTFYGGNQPETPYDMKEDASGNIYLSGLTMSPDLPLSSNALQTVYSGALDGFALSFNPAVAGPASRNYSSYVDSDGDQVAYGIDYDSKSNIWLAGYTTGPLFASLNGLQKPTDGGNADAFVMAVNPCSYSLSLNSEQFPAQGGFDKITVTTGLAGCTWTASSSVDWVTLSPTSGAGTGTVTVTVAPNTSGAGRTANIIIAGATFLVGQDMPHSVSDNRRQEHR